MKRKKRDAMKGERKRDVMGSKHYTFWRAKRIAKEADERYAGGERERQLKWKEMF